MFFTSAPTKPFEDGNQAINSWPQWKLVTNKVSFNVLILGSNLGLWEKYQKWLEEDYLVLDNVNAVVEHVAKGGNYFILEDESITAQVFYNKKLIYPDFTLEVVAGVNTLSSCLVFPKGSPYTRMMNKGIMRHHQTGWMQLILEDWIQRLPRYGPRPADTTILSFQQTAPAFFAYGSVIIISVLIFIWEITYKCSINFNKS